MRILRRYILSEVISHALVGGALFTFVLFMRDLGQILELVVRESASLTSVGETEHHADPRHLIDEGAAHRRQPAIDVQAAAARRVAAVIGDQHPTNAELIERLHEGWVACDGAHPLDIEYHAELAIRTAVIDILNPGNESIALRPLPDPVAHGG